MSDSLKPDSTKSTTTTEAAEDALKEAMDRADEKQISEVVKSMPYSETLRQVAMLDKDERDKLISMLAPETVADIIEEAPTELAVTIIKDLDIDVAAKIMEQLQDGIQASIVQELKEGDAEAILSAMSPENAEELRIQTQYATDTAGGLMDRQTFAFTDAETVGAVLKRLIAGDEEFERHRGLHPYIVDQTGKLVGVVSLRGLLRNKRTIPLLDIMSAPKAVLPETSQEELATLLADNPFLGLPVVDAEGLLIGAVSRDAVAIAELERAEHEALSRQQVSDELRSMPLILRSRRRLVWLSSNIVLNIIAASVIASYEETLAAVIAIAIFLPMVSDMSGCSGNQAVGVSMRELALGLTRPVDLFYVLKKEFGIGIINGIILGVLIGIVVWVWKGNPYLGLVIGMALAINTVIAVSIGGTVPLLLKRFGIDPAVASGPLLTTITDMAGFFLVLSLAAAFMDQLLVG